MNRVARAETPGMLKDESTDRPLVLSLPGGLHTLKHALHAKG